MAACLQDNGRATIVGTRSWGKGTVQTVMYFEGGRSRLKLTVATYWRPSGNNIHRHVDATPEDAWGVSPDEGYAVETDEEMFKNIVEYRRERDKVNITKEISPDVESETDSTDTQRSEAADPELQVDSPNLQNFEDPQLRRAIEAVQEAMDASRERTNSA
jgi:carboxyl-terminal processing protease